MCRGSPEGFGTSAICALRPSTVSAPDGNNPRILFLMSQGGEVLSGFRRLGMPAFSARSLALDGVSWAQGGKVENEVGR